MNFFPRHRKQRSNSVHFITFNHSYEILSYRKNLQYIERYTWTGRISQGNLLYDPAVEKSMHFNISTSIVVCPVPGMWPTYWLDFNILLLLMLFLFLYQHDNPLPYVIACPTLSRSVRFSFYKYKHCYFLRANLVRCLDIVKNIVENCCLNVLNYAFIWLLIIFCFI